MRIGVGSDLPPEAIAAGGGKRPGKDYLLSPMRKPDLAVLDEVLDRVATATRRILELGPAAAMNEFNRKGDREWGSGIRKTRDREERAGRCALNTVRCEM